MKFKLFTVFCLVFSTGVSVSNVANAAELDKPKEICSLINDTMILTKSCEVDTSAQVISFEISLKSRRAAMLCGSIKRIAYANGWALPTDWTIKVDSATAPDEPSAECAYKSTDLFG